MKARQTKKTDNHSVKAKLAIRREAASCVEELHVLDAFAGENVLWSQIPTKSYYGIEREQGKGKNLHLANERVLASLNLSRFTLIDLDAYGIPTRQLQIIFKNPTLRKGTVIVYTAIRGGYSRIPRELSELIGASGIMKKCPSIIAKRAYDAFEGFLFAHGVREVRETESNDQRVSRKYGYFVY